MGDPFTNELPQKLAIPPHSKSLEARRVELIGEIEAVQWEDFDTAYGASESVPLDLKLLMFGDQKQSLAATHRLWCGLCHQHAHMSSAAEPALAFLLLALRESDDLIKIEVLDILVGFVICQQPEIEFSQRVLCAIVERRQEIEDLKSSQHEEVAGFANSVCEALDETQAAEQDGESDS